MLGVAAEAEFLRLLKTAGDHPIHGHLFNSAKREKFIAAKISRFQNALGGILKSLPNEATEGLETNLNAIQLLIRVARNEAGHPSAARLTREQVYVYLQLFAPYARQLMLLRHALT
jgi:hypothetical protein